MVRVKWFDNLAYYVRYLAIYVAFFGLFFQAGWGKLFGGESAPAKMFTHSWVDEIVGTGDGLSAVWDLDGIGELIVALLVLASLVTGEWRIGYKKQFLRIGLAVAMLLFAVMVTGMSAAGNNSGAASLFFYFGAAGVTYLLVRHDEREAEFKEVRTGVTRGTATDDSNLGPNPR